MAWTLVTCTCLLQLLARWSSQEAPALVGYRSLDFCARSRRSTTKDCHPLSLSVVMHGHAVWNKQSVKPNPCCATPKLARVLQALLPEEDASVGIHVGAIVEPVSICHMHVCVCVCVRDHSCLCKHAYVLRPWVDGLYSCKLPKAMADEMKNDPRNSKVVKKTILKSGRVSVHIP